MTVDGGTLVIVGDDLLLGKNDGSGTLDMISGSIDVARDFEVGGGNPGFVYMRGGTIAVGDDLMIPEIGGTQAEVYLNGGTISLSGDLTMGLGVPYSHNSFGNPSSFHSVCQQSNLLVSRHISA